LDEWQSKQEKGLSEQSSYMRWNTRRAKKLFRGVRTVHWRI